MPRRAAPKAVRPQAASSAKMVLEWFGDHAPAEVTREECRAYIAARRAAGRRDATIRNELSILKAALNWRDPKGPHVVELPPAGPPRERFLSREEVARLLEAAAPTPHVALFVQIAIATGARRGAILEMTWSTHVDLERGAIWPGFRPGGKNRAKPIPMTASLARALAEAREAAQGPYVVEWAGKPVKTIRRALAAAYARAGVTDVAAPAHVLRHTAGAWMAMAGVPLHEIAVRLGHSTIRVTERHYAHLAPEAMARSTAALELGGYFMPSGSIEPQPVNAKGTKRTK
ncbi:MAG: site-specific integrase [Parvularculaceae bacterium]|nr:site-specific integrase [Parvularculaceae bacterium]